MALSNYVRNLENVIERLKVKPYFRAETEDVTVSEPNPDVVRVNGDVSPFYSVGDTCELYEVANGTGTGSDVTIATVTYNSGSDTTDIQFTIDIDSIVYDRVRNRTYRQLGVIGQPQFSWSPVLTDPDVHGRPQELGFDYEFTLNVKQTDSGALSSLRSFTERYVNIVFPNSDADLGESFDDSIGIDDALANPDGLFLLGQTLQVEAEFNFDGSESFLTLTASGRHLRKDLTTTRFQISL